MHSTSTFSRLNIGPNPLQALIYRRRFASFCHGPFRTSQYTRTVRRLINTVTLNFSVYITIKNFFLSTFFRWNTTFRKGKFLATMSKGQKQFLRGVIESCPAPPFLGSPQDIFSDKAQWWLVCFQKWKSSFYFELLSSKFRTYHKSSKDSKRKSGRTFRKAHSIEVSFTLPKSNNCGSLQVRARFHALSLQNYVFGEVFPVLVAKVKFARNVFSYVSKIGLSIAIEKKGRRRSARNLQVLIVWPWRKFPEWVLRFQFLLLYISPPWKLTQSTSNQVCWNQEGSICKWNRTCFPNIFAFSL